MEGDRQGVSFLQSEVDKHAFQLYAAAAEWDKREDCLIYRCLCHCGIATFDKSYGKEGSPRLVLLGHAWPRFTGIGRQ